MKFLYSRTLNPTSQGSSNKSFMQWVDKIARSTYFQKAADNKYVQRTMEYVSNTSLALQVFVYTFCSILMYNSIY